VKVIDIDIARGISTYLTDFAADAHILFEGEPEGGFSYENDVDSILFKALKGNSDLGTSS